METLIPKYGLTTKTYKRRKPRKPFWNDDLQSLWNVMCTREKDYLKYRGSNQGRQRLRLEYVSARHTFDKHLRQCERIYKREQAFWRKIQNPIRDEERVFEKWRLDFRDLYNCDDNQDFDDNHYEQTKLHRLLLENNMNDPLNEPNHELNTNITVDEITRILKTAKRVA